MSTVAVTNTIAFVFPDNAAQPTMPEMVRFVKGLNGAKKQMDTAYKNAEERAVFIKYKTEQGMREALFHNEVKQIFHYSNGKQVEVCMSVAGCNIQYVRVFDLPPEVSDAVLAAELKKFGCIKRCVREKYPLEYELDLFTGVRGIYMDVEKEIPPVLSFLNRRGRVFYRGGKLRCFACGQEGHLKKSCGKRKAENTDAAIEEEEGTHSFAAVLAETSTSNRSMSSHETGDKLGGEEEGSEEEEAAAANVGIASSDNRVEETDSGEKIHEETDSIEIDKAAVAEESFDMSTWHRIAHCIQDFNSAKKQQEAEKQKKQGNKSGTRPKTGFSPPMKKKY